ncbi:MAG: RNA polymerase sigma factor [Planctomycetota bacterium]
MRLDDFPSVLVRAKAGDRDAIESLLLAHLQQLRAFVRLQSGRAVRQRESCSDLVQSVCREVLRDLADVQCRDEVAFRDWLYTVAKHKILHRVAYYAAQKRDARKEVAAARSDEDDRELLHAYARITTPSHDVSMREEVRRIEDAMDGLSDEERDIIVQARLLGHTHAQLAAELGKSEVAVRKMLSRARAKLGLLLDRQRH